jgi:tetratricopeptide (TPR) repeat protein
LEISRRIGDEATAAVTLVEFGKLLWDPEDMQEAITAFIEALVTYERLGMPHEIGIMLETLGGVHERQDEYEAALEKYQQALEVLLQYGSPQEQAITERDIARMQARLRGTG